MITGCCVCLARSAAFRSKGLTEAARKGFMIASGATKRPPIVHCYFSTTIVPVIFG
jgi:hypothetical protein